jgi:hypothetical protein
MINDIFAYLLVHHSALPLFRHAMASSSNVMSPLIDPFFKRLQTTVDTPVYTLLNSFRG